MSAPKPHIKPKADPWRQQMQPQHRDVPPYTQWDPPVFGQRDDDAERKPAGQVLFHEDDCLR
ncbi:MAG TPA: hypothetical protein VHY36_00770 [Steroidobacteraceae bacterium]|jgi:hypothetical protein|nr:hypothetical protein [Steroidobacteraceae bacterium]